MLNNHVIREPGIKAVWGQDSIKVDGDEIPYLTERIYLMINKPFGYICTMNDPEERPVVTDLIKDITERIYPVGRLDFDSLGLLLLTNDGEWAHRLSHPRFKVPKTYKITIKGGLSRENLDSLKKGIELEDGFVKPSKVTLLKRRNDQELLRITMTSGKSRVIRRLFEHLNHQVIHLIRIGYGNLSLGNLKIGQYRLLEPDEIDGLKRMVGLK
jgi:23S rRNA pseudouridine2605 synthase